jgi:hypothetical protein
MGAAAGAVIVAERRMVEAFERAGATTPDSARTPDELSVHTGSLGWRRLTRRAVIRESSPGSGQYYLDREVWEALRRTRHRLLIVLIVAMLGVWLYVAVMGIVRGSSRMQPAAPGQPAAAK